MVGTQHVDLSTCCVHMAVTTCTHAVSTWPCAGAIILTAPPPVRVALELRPSPRCVSAHPHTHRARMHAPARPRAPTHTACAVLAGWGLGASPPRSPVWPRDRCPIAAVPAGGSGVLIKSGDGKACLSSTGPGLVACSACKALDCSWDVSSGYSGEIRRRRHRHFADVISKTSSQTKNVACSDVTSLTEPAARGQERTATPAARTRPPRRCVAMRACCKARCYAVRCVLLCTVLCGAVQAVVHGVCGRCCRGSLIRWLRRSSRWWTSGV